MATRFYLPATGTTPSITVSPTSRWTVTTDYISHVAITTKTNTAEVDGTPRSGGSTNLRTILDRQYISEPLTAQTISGTFSMVAEGDESHNNANAWLDCRILVVSNDGSIVRGILYAGSTATEASATVGAENEECATSGRTRIKNAIALSSVTTQAGDRLVFELGAKHQNTTSSYNVIISYGDPVDSDAALTSGDSLSSAAPWFELSHDLTFDTGSISGSASLTGLGTLSATGTALTGGGGGGGTPATITLMGTPTLAEGDGTSVNIAVPYPSGIQAGELLLANIVFSQEIINATPPSGWNLLYDHQNATANTMSGAIFYRIATGTETGTVTFDGDPSDLQDGRITGRMSRWSGVDTITPIDVTGVSAGAGNVSSLDMPSITTVTNGAVLIHQLTQNSVNSVISTLSGTTRYGENTSGVTGRVLFTFYETRPTAGATGTRTWTSNTAVQWGGITVALRPAIIGGTPQATLTGSGTLTATGTQTGVTPTLVHRIVGVPGTTSSTVSVRVNNASTLRLKASTDSAGTIGVVWGNPVVPSGLGDAKLPISGLTPGTHYYYRVAMTNGGTEYLDTHATIGRLRTAPSGQANFAFNFSSCSTQDNPASMATIAARNDDLFFHLGDFYYADGSGTGIENFRTKFNTKINSANHSAVFATTPTNYTPSDHDGMNNNGSAGNDPTAWANWRTVYEEVFPAPDLYYSFMYGRVLFIQINDRSFKSATSATDNSSKTALGATQKQWLKDQITNTTAKAIVIAQPTPWIAAAETGGDGWAGFTTERTELANFFAASGKPIVMLGGDMHALAADDGTNAPGGITMFHAAPLYNSSSHKGGPYTVSPYPTTTGTNVSQYGRCVVTDTGTQISFAYTGYSSDNTARITLTKNFSVAAETTASLTGSGTLTATGTVTSVTKLKQWSGNGLSAGAFTASTVGTGDTAFTGTYGSAPNDLTLVDSGPRSPRLQSSGTNGTSGVYWDFATPLTNYTVRTYLEIGGYSTTSSGVLMNAFAASDTVTSQWRFDLAPSGAIRFRGLNNTAIWSPSTTLALNTNYRIELVVSDTTLNLYIYEGDSTTLYASQTGLTVGSGMGRIRFGDSISDTVDGKKYDDMAISDSAALIGPETSETVNYTGNASFSGSGILSGLSTLVTQATTTSLSGTGTLTTLTNIITTSQSGTLSGSGILTAVGNTTYNASVPLTGSGTLTAQTSTTVPVNVSLTGSGTLTASTDVTSRTETVSLTGSGQLTITVITINHTGSVLLTGSGILTPTISGIFTDRTATLSGSGTLTAIGSIDPAYISGWGLPSWRDEFEGSVVDTSKWVIRDNSTHGNLSYDWAVIDDTTNTVSIVNNQLRIRANKLETPIVSGGKTRYWTTGYLDTIGKMTKTYGRWEMRAKLPTVRNTSQGLWPAFWLRNGSVGEIDILESWGDPPRNRARAANLSETSTFTMHESTNGGGASQGWTYEHRANPSHSSSSVYNTAQGMHTWALEYTPTYLKAFFDGIVVVHIVPTGELVSGTTVDYSWVWGPNFTSPWNIRLNLQVGDPYWSSFDTAPDDTLTSMPADYLVDYVRVWDYTEPPPPPPITKLKQWSGDGLAAGAFTTAGSVGTSDTAFDGIYGTAGDITVVNSGTRSPRLQVSGATSASGVYWDFATPLTNYSVRTYFEYSGYSTSSSGSIFGALSSDFTSILWRFDISPSGAVRFRGAAAAAIWSPATTLALNTVYRIECTVSGTSMDLYIYEGDSTTVYASILGLTVGSGMGRLRFGDSISDTTDGKKYDDMAVGDTATLIGPAVITSTFNGSGSGTLTVSPITVGRTGTASLTGSGTLTATAVDMSHSRSATLTGSGTLAANTSSAASVTTSLTGTGTLTASAITVGRTGTVSLTGSGTLTAATGSALVTSPTLLTGTGLLTSGGGGSTGFTAATELSGTGNLTSLVTVAASQNSSLTGTGILGLTVVPMVSKATSLTGSGTLTSTVGIVTRTGSVQLSGTGTLSAIVTGMAYSRTVNLSGAGILTVSTSTAGAISANLSGAGTLTAVAGIVSRTGTALFTGSGTVTTNVNISTSRNASFTGSGAVSASSALTTVITCNLTGSGVLTTSTSSTSTGNAVLTGIGSLSTSVSTSIVQVHTFTGLGTLSALANSVTQQTSATFTGIGTLNTQTAGSGTGTANLTGSGTLTSTVQVQILKSAGFTGSGILSSTAVIAFIAQISLTGSGTLSATGQQIISKAVGVTGSGILTTSVTPKAIRNVGLTGVGTLTTSVTSISTVRIAGLTGTGTLTAISTNVHQVASASFNGTGTIGFQSATAGTGSANLSGSGTLSAIGTTKAIQNAAFSGSSALNTNTNLSISITSTFNSTGTLTSETEPALNRMTVLSGSGTLTTVRNISTNTETNFSGGSTLTVNTVVNPRIIPGTLELLTIKMNSRQYNGTIIPNRFTGSITRKSYPKG